MVTANPARTTEHPARLEDERPPWRRARELLDAGHPWPQIKACMFADYRARMTFAKLLQDPDMADLAHADFHGTVSEIEETTIGEEEMIAILEDLDRRDGLPPFDYRAVGAE